MHRVADLYRVVVVTARPESTSFVTRRWLSRHFGRLIHDVSFIKGWSLPGERAQGTKAEFCRSRGIAVIVEDSREYVAECCDFGMQAILLDKPWNSGSLPPAAERVPSWADAVTILEDRAAWSAAHHRRARR